MRARCLTAPLANDAELSWIMGECQIEEIQRTVEETNEEIEATNEEIEEENEELRKQMRNKKAHLMWACVV